MLIYMTSPVVFYIIIIFFTCKCESIGRFQKVNVLLIETGAGSAEFTLLIKIIYWWSAKHRG